MLSKNQFYKLVTLPILLRYMSFIFSYNSKAIVTPFKKNHKLSMILYALLSKKHTHISILFILSVKKSSYMIITGLVSMNYYVSSYHMPRALSIAFFLLNFISKMYASNI